MSKERREAKSREIGEAAEGYVLHAWQIRRSRAIYWLWAMAFAGVTFARTWGEAWGSQLEQPWRGLVNAALLVLWYGLLAAGLVWYVWCDCFGTEVPKPLLSELPRLRHFRAEAICAVWQARRPRSQVGAQRRAPTACAHGPTVAGASTPALQASALPCRGNSTRLRGALRGVPLGSLESRVLPAQQVGRQQLEVAVVLRLLHGDGLEEDQSLHRGHQEVPRVDRAVGEVVVVEEADGLPDLEPVLAHAEIAEQVPDVLRVLRGQARAVFSRDHEVDVRARRPQAIVLHRLPSDQERPARERELQRGEVYLHVRLLRRGRAEDPSLWASPASVLPCRSNLDPGGRTAVRPYVALPEGCNGTD